MYVIFIYVFYIWIRWFLEKINDFLKMVVWDDIVDWIFINW